MKYKLESVHLGTQITVENLPDYYPVVFKYEPKTISNGIFITLSSVAKLMSFANDVGHSIIVEAVTWELTGYNEWLENGKELS